MKHTELDLEIALLATEFHEMHQQIKRDKEASKITRGLQETIHGHLQTLRDRGTDPDVQVKKVTPVGWLSSLAIPTGQLIKGSYRGHFKVTDVVKAWEIPDACETTYVPGEYYGYNQSTIYSVVPEETATHNALLTEDGLITTAHLWLPIKKPVAGTRAIRESDLVPIETADSLRWRYEPPALGFRLDLPHVAAHLGTLAAS